MFDIQEIVKDRILLLDGAMGTMIQSFRLEEGDYRGSRFTMLPGMQKGNNDLLTLSRPDIIESIHIKYLEAGADIIETNTFNAQKISMADYHCEHLCCEINLSAARLARKVADDYTLKNPDKPRFVAGSVGPTNKTCSMSPDVNDPALRTLTFDMLVEAYLEQMLALLEGGVDVLLIETIFDTLNAKAALFAAEEAMKKTRTVPVMLSVTVADQAGRTLSGQTLEAFWVSVSHYPVFSIGLNCSFGAKEMKPFLRKLSERVPCYVSAYPNAGLPNHMGEYTQSPADMALEMQGYVQEGLVNIIGGCCGTSDAYIQALHEMLLANVQPELIRIPKLEDHQLRLSGLEELVVRPDSNFINVGERCNVAGSRKFLRLIREKDYVQAAEIARKQVDDGALVLDVNLDDGMLEARTEMEYFLRYLTSDPEISKVPIMIDSSKWEVIEAGLKCVQGKCIINSLSLKDGEEVFVERATYVKRMGAALVVMAFDEKGQADTYERKIEVCQRAYHLLTQKVGFPPCDIIFDPNILSICTGIQEHDSYAMDFIRATEWIRQNLPHSHVVGGVSNLSFSFRGNNYIREAMHAVFLYHAIRKGMDMGIVNPATSVLYEEIPTELLTVLEDVVLNQRPSTEKLLDLAPQYAQASSAVSVENTQELAMEALPLEDRIAHLLVKGTTLHLEEYLMEAVQCYPNAISIVEGPLMKGMNMVGERFAQGKMFLPQVVKTARTMKCAVNILQPFIQRENSAKVSAGKVLLATVKGDVHDIGKNIVSLVMACNNYEIVDLGVMCLPDKIVEEAIREQVDVIGLSGLITPSLEEMVNVAKALERSPLRVPLVIGGAATSLEHTLLNISTVYSGPTVWGRDASQMVTIVNQLLSQTDQWEVARQLNSQAKKAHVSEQEIELETLTMARKNKMNLF